MILIVFSSRDFDRFAITLLNSFLEKILFGSFVFMKYIIIFHSYEFFNLGSRFWGECVVVLALHAVNVNTFVHNVAKWPNIL